MKIFSLVSCVVFTLSFSSISMAQSPGGKGGKGGSKGGARFTPPIMKALDANGDHKIDAEEIANASKALLALDKNKDGVLTSEEYRYQPGGSGGSEGGKGSMKGKGGESGKGGMKGKGGESGKGKGGESGKGKSGKGKGAEEGGGGVVPKRPTLEEEA